MSAEQTDGHLSVPPNAVSRSSAAHVLADLVGGLRNWPIWTLMAWQDIRLRYRGSVLGPFWLTLSMAIMILALGFLYARLFRMEINEYLPFLCLGLLSWTLVSTIITEACASFINAENIIKQIKLPYSIHAYRVVWRNVIIAAHNVVVYLFVMLYFEIMPGLKMLYLIPGLALVMFNGVWVCLLFGMICARFRDVPQIVASLVQVIFFVTPIIWKPELMGEHEVWALLNPFFAIVDLIRAPLLNQAPHLTSWVIVLAITGAGWALTIATFRRLRARIPYWV